MGQEQQESNLKPQSKEIAASPDTSQSCICSPLKHALTRYMVLCYWGLAGLDECASGAPSNWRSGSLWKRSAGGSRSRFVQIGGAGIDEYCSYGLSQWLRMRTKNLSLCTACKGNTRLTLGPSRARYLHSTMNYVSACLILVCPT
jgi:hypothetical protein